MGLDLTYYLADFMTGDLLEPLPIGSVSGVSLDSSLKPGRVQATVNLEATGFSMAEARSWVGELQHGRCTLVPIREGVTNGIGNITSRELGEWWICAARGTRRSPEVVISGPEWDGYAQHVLLADDFIGDSVDPVVAARQMLWDLYTTSQSVAADLQEWISHTNARVRADFRRLTEDYWSAIKDLQTAEDGPFEWMTRTGLVLDGWVPRRVTRTLEIGQPRMDFRRQDIVLEVSAPGQPPATLLDAGWGWDKRNAASTVYGFGGGAGDDQWGPLWRSRSRVPSEPAVNALITRRDAGSQVELYRYLDQALALQVPEEKTFPATMPIDSYTLRKGETVTFMADAGWSQPAVEHLVQVAGWTWSDSSPDVYDLDLVEV